MMLARAATRKLRRDAFASRAPTRLAEALTLPSTLPRLCAVQLRHLSQSPSQWQPQSPSPSPSPSPSSSTPTPTHTHTNTHDARRIQRRPSLSPHDHDGARTTTTTSTRSLVTTAELPHSPPSLDGFMQAWGSTVPSPSLSRLNAWDTASPLVVHDHLSHAMPQMRAVAHGITGDPVEMLQNLYACLRVGRTDRAALILKRLSIMYTPRAPEMVDAHNVFLQTLFEQELAQCEPGAGTDAMQTVEQWFQKNMVAKHIAPNAATFVTLLRAAVNFLKGDAQDRQVRALLDMANDCGPDVLEQVNTSPDLTDDEWNTIIRLQPDSFDEPPPVAHLRDMQYNTAHAVRSAVDHGLPVEAAHPHQIRSVDQKGLGLSTLQKALATLHRSDSVPYPHDMEGTPEEKDRAYAYARQLQIEKDGLEAAVERWREEDEKLTDLGIHGVLKNKSLQALMYNWYKALIPMFKQQIAHAKHVTSNPTEDNATDEVNYYGAWLEMCTPERLAANTVSRIVNACVETQTGHGDNLKLATISTLIGNDIMDHINTDAQTRHDKFLKAQRRQARKDLVATLSKTPIEKPDTGVKGPINVSEVPFQKTEIPVSARVKIGALCLEYLLQAARITVTAEDPKTGERVTSTQAGFHHQMMLHQGKKIGWVVPHHEVLAKLRNDPVHNIVSVRLPMVIPPKAWSGFDNGGYYTLPSKVVRQKAGDISQRAYAAAAIENGDMKQVLAGLDTLGKVPWQINKPVLDVMTAAWNTGEGIGALVAEHTTNLEPPPDPPANATYPERAAWGKAMKQYQNTKSGYHSQRCFQNFQLEIANAMAQEKAIYFPHSVDFRGRAYPIPPILNHIGSDVARGLLKFANGKELGSVGLQWLKVHLANLAGFDKASLREREQFAMDNMDEIIDSATKPLDGRRWWAKAEDPWQCLACCMDLKNAFDLPDPTRHVSQLPVHQDGTCNGLQHYAALGGDEAGARQVNLEPSDRPQDIYTGVADLVKAMVDADAEKGVPVATFIKGHISRKVVKRTVMTNVYGVTFMGAKAQVLDTLKDMFPNFRESADMRSLQPVAVYVAFKIFEALGKIFNGAQEIQYWLGECGDRITTSLTPEQIEMIKDRFEGKGLLPDARYKTKKSTKTGTKLLGKAAETFKTGIIWTTPLKMPIVQPYTKDHSVKVKTALQEIIIQKKIGADSVDKRKQLQAFPPNFIHSLDATHMLLSALKCNEVGLEFAAVHDSFWTHACDIPNLNTILRDAFVRMHSEDITGRLAAEFAARYADNMHRANVHAGSDVGVRISKWRIANKSAPTETSEGIGRSYGKASIDELALEAKRQELLKSDDPELRAKGEAMVTPTSIWLEEADPKSLASQRMSLLGETKATKATEATEAAAPLSDKERAVLAEAEALEAATDADLPSETTADGIKETADDAQPPKQRAARPKGSWMAERSIIQVWIPLTFPPVPKKGTWDVTRLRESKYFFS